MIEFTINNTRKILAPSRWNEINTDQFIRIEAADKNDILGLFSILTGLELDIISSAKDKQLEESLFACVAFIFAPPNWAKLKHSTHLEYKNVLYKVPTDFNKMMLGQKILVSQISQKTNIVQNIAEVVAICMQPIIDNVKKYDEKRVEKIKVELLKENGMQVYLLAKFFFRHLVGSSSIGRNNSQTFPQQKVQRQRSYQNWLSLVG